MHIRMPELWRKNLRLLEATIYRCYNDKYSDYEDQGNRIMTVKELRKQLIIQKVRSGQGLLLCSVQADLKDLGRKRKEQTDETPLS